jgi:hypothetical protein
MTCDNVTIGGVEYVPKCSLPTGNRAVVVVDRGWIFAGDVSEDGDHLVLTRVVWVRNWSQIGFDGVIANPDSAQLTKRKMDNPVRIPTGSEIFRVPVGENWGL